MSDANTPITFLLCTNRRLTDAKASCGNAGAEALWDVLLNYLENQGNIRVERITCLGYCEQGPNIKVLPGGKTYHELTPEKLTNLLIDLNINKT